MLVLYAIGSYIRSRKSLSGDGDARQYPAWAVGGKFTELGHADRSALDAVFGGHVGFPLSVTAFRATSIWEAPPTRPRRRGRLRNCWCRA